MKNVKKIDIHAHATPFKEYAPPMASGLPLPSAEEVIKFYDDLNIEKGVLLPLGSAECHYEVVTGSDCKYTSDRFPDRFLWFCGLDPRACGHSATTDHSIHLMHYKALGAKGVGELTAQLPTDDPIMDNFFAHCAACDMPVTIHIAPKHGGYYGIIDDIGLPRLEKMMKKHKNLKILGHSQYFWSEISADVTEEIRGIYPTGKVTEGRVAKLLRECENLYCDLSAGSGANALMRDPEYAARFVEEFADRLLYGCDICSVKNTHPYRFEEFLDNMVDNGYISQENYYKMVRGNAVKLLNLEDK